MRVALQRNDERLFWSLVFAWGYDEPGFDPPVSQRASSLARSSRAKVCRLQQ